jgi:type II secretory ATPase GspE/PulE/Tfp pilus assembly ATPase PilB-like protein
MGVDPYLIAPTLKMAIAQRLARTLCDGKGVEEEIDVSTEYRIQDTFKSLPNKYHNLIPKNRTVLHPEPTATCSTGYRGRTAVTEVLEINEEMQELILKNASEEEFFQSARKNGFVTIQEDAIIKALNHEIPYEEMTAFSTKVGIDSVGDDEVLVPTVDNLQEIEVAEAIMKDDEASTN